MGRRKKRKPRAPKHRSPLPPPGQVIDKKSCRRNVAKRRIRKQIGEEL